MWVELRREDIGDFCFTLVDGVEMDRVKVDRFCRKCFSASCLSVGFSTCGMVCVSMLYMESWLVASSAARARVIRELTELGEEMGRRAERSWRMDSVALTRTSGRIDE